MTVWDVSIWWVLLAAVVYFAIGAVWYSPVMFAKQWAAELGRKTGDMGANAQSAMVITFLCMVVLVFVDAYLVHRTGTFGFMRGAFLGAKIWLGFVATSALVNRSFQNSSIKLYVIDQGYHLVGIVLATGILAHFVGK